VAPKRSTTFSWRRFDFDREKKATTSHAVLQKMAHQEWNTIAMGNRRDASKQRPFIIVRLSMQKIMT